MPLIQCLMQQLSPILQWRNHLNSSLPTTVTNLLDLSSSLVRKLVWLAELAFLVPAIWHSPFVVQKRGQRVKERLHPRLIMMALGAVQWQALGVPRLHCVRHVITLVIEMKSTQMCEQFYEVLLFHPLQHTLQSYNAQLPQSLTFY